MVENYLPHPLEVKRAFPEHANKMSKEGYLGVNDRWLPRVDRDFQIVGEKGSDCHNQANGCISSH